MRHEFEMTENQLAELLNASQPVMMIALQCGDPPSPRQNAHSVWQRWGDEMGFIWDSAKPVPSKGQRFFTAEIT